ncbi:MAG: BrxE family protein [Myxococcales bacterium]|nr:BrxE family protein [Myxococcales bacterium]
MHTRETNLDFDRLFKLRLVVARHGEMDGAGWWNTQGMLGPRGAAVLKRGFPRTHHFAQARVVFEVAKSRSREVFPNPDGTMTLWHLPAELEEQFEEHWQEWLDEGDKWEPIFAAVEAQNGQDLLQSLSQLDLVSEAETETVSKLKRSAESRAVPIAGSHQPTNDLLTLLAAAFSRGEQGKPAIPYAKLEN